jgi:hypothetical protein
MSKEFDEQRKSDRESDIGTIAEVHIADVLDLHYEAGTDGIAFMQSIS